MVVHTWRVETSDAACAFCRFVEREVQMSYLPADIQILVYLDLPIPVCSILNSTQNWG